MDFFSYWKKSFNFLSRLCSISHVAECNHSTDNETFKTGINGDLANFPQKRRLYEWCISICTVGHLRQTCLSTAANRRRREDALLTKTFLPKKFKPPALTLKKDIWNNSHLFTSRYFRTVSFSVPPQMDKFTHWLIPRFAEEFPKNNI